MSIVSYPQVKKRESFKIIFNGIKFVCPLWFQLSLFSLTNLKSSLTGESYWYAVEYLFATIGANYEPIIHIIIFNDKSFLIVGHKDKIPMTANSLATFAFLNFQFLHFKPPLWCRDFSPTDGVSFLLARFSSVTSGTRILNTIQSVSYRLLKPTSYHKIL